MDDAIPKSPVPAPEPTITTPTPPKKGKKLYIISILVVLLLVLIFLAGIFLGKTFLSQDNQPDGKENSDSVITETKNYKLAGVLVIKEGTVEIENTDGTWKSLDKGQKIIGGDQIRTGAESKAVFEIDDGSSVQFSALTDSVILITQLQGRVYHRVQPGALVYNVKSLNVLATALGTKFSVTSNAEEESTEIAVFENSVQITAKGEETQSDTAGKGEKATYDNKSEKLATSELSTSEQNENFYEWNKILDEDKEQSSNVTPTTTSVPTPKPTTKPAESGQPASGSLTLSATAGAGKVTLNWTLTGSSPYGFKVVSSRNSDPTYPAREGDQAVFISSDNRSYTWSGLNAGTTYHFRVGIYNSGKIVSYSNDVTATPTQGESTSGNYATSVNLNVESSTTAQAKLTWTISGGSAPKGFKLIYSQNPGPTYPPRNGEDLGRYENRPELRDYPWTGLTSGTTYYFRVGVYDGAGHIVTYSNEVSIVIK